MLIAFQAISTQDSYNNPIKKLLPVPMPSNFLSAKSSEISDKGLKRKEKVLMFGSITGLESKKILASPLSLALIMGLEKTYCRLHTLTVTKKSSTPKTTLSL